MLKRLFVILQQLLPTRLIGRMVYRISRSQNRLLKNLLIRGFVRLYRVDITEAEHPVPDGYESFNAFFARRLQAGARSFDSSLLTLCSPVDGTIQQIGPVKGNQILQAKGMTYSLDELLGGDDEATALYSDGEFITVYLAPHNYHRIHMPTTAKVRKMSYIPGKRMAVNKTTAAIVPGLFSGNERVVCHFESSRGPFALVLVGAMNVASISTSWAGEVLPRRPDTIEHWFYPADDGSDDSGDGSGDGSGDRSGDRSGIQLAKGDTLGQFNLGSTIIITLPPGAVSWRPELAAGQPVRVGDVIGAFSQLEDR